MTNFINLPAACTDNFLIPVDAAAELVNEQDILADQKALGEYEAHRCFSDQEESLRMTRKGMETHKEIMQNREAALKAYPELSREPEILYSHHKLLPEYVAMRERGEPHGFAAMLVTQSPPACQTDNVYCSGRGTLEDQLGEEQAASMTKIAERHGYRPGVRDVYEPGLARFQGDPQAFVPQTGGRAHVKKVLRERGYNVRHGVGVASGISAEPRQPDSAPRSIPLAEDLIRDNAQAILVKEPEKRKLSKGELRELVIERHGKPARDLPVTKQ